MDYNNIFAIKQKVKKNVNIDNFMSEALQTFDDVTKIYSFIIYSDYNDDIFVGWIVQYNISQNDEYNTIDVHSALYDIACRIKFDKETDDRYRKHVIGYSQPSLDVQVMVYDPLIRNLALKMSARWNTLEYDDLYQTCRLCLIILYNKGYYIHKRLLERAFTNAVLQSIRKRRNEPEILSIYQPYQGDDKEKLVLGDTIPDKALEQKQAEDDDAECDKAMFVKLKQLIISVVGERGYNELLRDYGNKHTTDMTRKMLQKVKTHFAKKGITIKSFDKYY